MALSRKGFAGPNLYEPNPQIPFPGTTYKSGEAPKLLDFSAMTARRPRLLDSPNGLPALTVNTVILGLELKETEAGVRRPDEPNLKLLLFRNEKTNRWTLPEAEPKLGTTLSETVRQLLTQTIGPNDAYIEKIGTFEAVRQSDDSWLPFSCAFLALVDLTDFTTAVSQFGLPEYQPAWFTVKFEPENQRVLIKKPSDDLTVALKSEPVINGRTLGRRLKAADQPIFMAHFPIVLEALIALRETAETSDKIFSLMPETFSLRCLQTVFEIVLGSKLLTPAFRVKIAPKLTATDVYLREKKFRPSRLFKFNTNWAAKTIV
ncbi:MAG: hypothetical protein LBT47_11100 [Deltaproteobacteria bacterium]|jgi:ADP-ribose pyrophosphatase YjhB (NUDIX family)|nr:hypothetical protein [Deltaproteobacteria bacterium]